MRQVTLSQLKQWEEIGKEFFLIDVREPNEHEAKNIGGILIPLDKIVKSRDVIPADIAVVFYCRKGIRSQIAIQKLQQFLIYDNLYNLKGGIGD